MAKFRGQQERSEAPREIRVGSRRGKLRRRRVMIGFTSFAAVALILLASAAWLGAKASIIQSELTKSAEMIPELQRDLAEERFEEASAAVVDLRSHTTAAKENAEDPLWVLASAVPWVGPNFSAIAEVARSADDVATLALSPLVKVFAALEWDALLPTETGSNLEPVIGAAPSVASAAHAVRVSAQRLNEIETNALLPQVEKPLARAKEQLNDVTGTLDAAADTSRIVPAMMGARGPRKYLVMIQNNAESRASGGIPGALAVLNLDQGKISLGTQSSATAVGVLSPAVAVDPEQQQIYSGRLGKFMQDVNLTPDFPTAASTAQAMWERNTGQRVDGVLAIDPVALSYLLDATGPVRLESPEVLAVAGTELPTELNSKNVVRTLLSDVYAGIEEPPLQDVYFAGVAQEIFRSLANGNADTKGLIKAITQGSEEGRVLIWSDRDDEQGVITKYPLSGSVSGPSVSPAQFGVYFNDGTGAKMDYYVKRTVQLVKECALDGYEQTTVRITSTSTAPANAATSLPAYVTGNGVYGIPPGSVQTNVVAYGPVQANVETAKVDGERADFAPYLHSNRPVGVLAVRLAPGESKTVEFTFGKIVQHTEPNVVVTPTIQDVKDVTLPTENAVCAPAS